MQLRFRQPLAATMLLGLVASSCGAGAQESFGLGLVRIQPGVLNRPDNKSLRFDILKFGMEQFCQEMTKRGAPLKLQDDEPVVGRFYADSCSTQVLDERQSVVLQYSGKGYGWTNVSQRLGFTSAGVVEYAPDFKLYEDSMYIYFRPKNLDSASFTTTLVESTFAQAGLKLTGFNADAVGRNMVESQLKRGFTVIRYDDNGETDLGLGIIPTGQKPFKPFNIKSSSRVALENNRTEVHRGQQDFVGGFEIKEEDQALFFTATVDGAPAVDVFVVPKGMGDNMLSQYAVQGGPAKLPQAPLLDEALTQGQTWKRFLPLPKGIYYLVFDNAAGVGRTDPQAVAGDDQAAKIDYLVQLGEAP